MSARQVPSDQSCHASPSASTAWREESPCSLVPRIPDKVYERATSAWHPCPRRALMTIRRMLLRQQPDSRCNGVQRFVPNSKCNSLLRRPGHRLTIAARVYAHSPRQARQLSSWDYALNMPSIKNLGSLTCLTGSSPPGREPIKWSRYMSHRRAFIPRLGRKFCPVRLDLSKRKPAPAQTFSYRRRRRAPTLQGGQSQRPTQAPSLMTLPPNSARQKSTDIDTRGIPLPVSSVGARCSPLASAIR